MPVSDTFPDPLPSSEACELLASLARPSAAYRRNAWLAMGVLLLFVAFYLALAGWFVFTAYQMLSSLGAGGDSFWRGLLGVCVAFLAVFMLKAMFFIEHGGTQDSLEVTPAEQPALFQFLHALADRAGAPRPHKVFISARVNAAVFYDLSVLNLLFPSRKNLEIGLGLVNVLSLGELRAVLAHEFGHFAQRSMAVGRWVYVAQQIAGHLVTRRDKLDGFLEGLSRLDPRIAWVGWVLRLVVWSIRGLIDSTFRLVLRVQRALSREMEMNADLVAVSLTGSDALVQALHRLQAGDDAWARAAAFVMGEKACGHITADLFTIQSRLMAHMARLRGDDHRLPAAAQGGPPGSHRLFQAELAEPPQMWRSHPSNHDREVNAKQRYVPAEIDERSAWALFGEPEALRARLTGQFLSLEAPQCVPIDESLARLDQQFAREAFQQRYQGVYFGRSLTRHVEDPCYLWDHTQPAPRAADLEALYPHTLSEAMGRLRVLEKELAQLKALHDGRLDPPGGVIRHRDRVLRRAQLPQAIAESEADLAAVRAQLRAHDHRCRSLHLALARIAGQGWEAYLQGLVAVMHYADHTEDDLRDLRGLLSNTVEVVTAVRRVGSDGVNRVVREANQLHDALEHVHLNSSQVTLGADMLQPWQASSWREVLGDMTLPRATPDNINDWLGAIDSWVESAAGACNTLYMHALNQLLLGEAALARHLAQGTPPDAAPTPCILRASYATLVAGQERPRQKRLGWWARFQNADGAVPATARWLAAAAIVGGVLGLGGLAGGVGVVVYNGLDRPLRVRLDGHELQLGPHQSARQSLPRDAHATVEALTLQGQLIERFEVDLHNRHLHVYNVAGAAPLVEWTAVYGPGSPPANRHLGAPRWSETTSDVQFAEPPQRIKGQGTRRVLASTGELPPGQQLGLLPSPEVALVAAHARWDALEARDIHAWWAMLLSMDASQARQILQARLAEVPDDPLLLRLARDSADTSTGARDEVCRQHQAHAQAEPQNANWWYAAARCLPGPQRDVAMLDGHARHPRHAWLAYAAAGVEARRGHWPQALEGYDLAGRHGPLAEAAGVQEARVRRWLRRDDSGAPLAALRRRSAHLNWLLSLEDAEPPSSLVGQGYVALARGELDQALRKAREADDPALLARFTRLAAASDGASPALVSQALALPPEQGMDDQTVWPSLALAARAGRDLAPFHPAVQEAAEQDGERLLAFLEALRAGRGAVEAERRLGAVLPELRGEAYAMGLVMLGSQAPAAWREGVRRLLFISERPYFKE